MPTDIQATSQIYWIAALVAALIDVILVGILVWRLKKGAYRELQPALTIFSLVFWGAIYTWATYTFWDSCYQYVLPEWVRWIVVPFGLAEGLLGYLFWWISLRLPGNPLGWFFLMGGLHSLPGHLHAIYSRGLLQKCPILVGVSAASALVFGIFEFVFYWCIALIVSAFVQQISRRI